MSVQSRCPGLGGLVGGSAMIRRLPVYTADESLKDISKPPRSQTRTHSCACVRPRPVSYRRLVTEHPSR